jgi:hypothetical protein
MAPRAAGNLHEISKPAACQCPQLYTFVASIAAIGLAFSVKMNCVPSFAAEAAPK